MCRETTHPGGRGLPRDLRPPGPLLAAAGMGRRYLASAEVAKIAHRFTDVLVLGSGVAGLAAALAASSRVGREVLVVSKRSLEECATRYAQGGIAAVVVPERTGDSTEEHLRDTLEVAMGLGDEAAVRVLVEEGVERVRQLLELGVELDRDPAGEVAVTREGGHSRPRILHRGDTTGQEIERGLLEAVRARANVLCLPHTCAVDLLTRAGRCSGALVCRPGGSLEALWARQTVLATGGAGWLYRESTNPSTSTADGLAMAFRAGAVLQDLEFVQFHPTTLYLAGAERFLITEAVRGEGGVLRDGSGRAFMGHFHPRGDLAPRDVVSRSILRVMKERGETEVWLDLSAIGEERIRRRFPRIVEFCQGFGLDVTRQPIPVRPSAHYSIGGVRTDLDGRTSLPGLLAAGEVASTGVHGANRMGSNSLLEGLVFGYRAGAAAASLGESTPLAVPFEVSAAEGLGTPERPAAEPDVEDLERSLKSLLWYRVGVERDGSELCSALEQIRSWLQFALRAEFASPEGWCLQNMLQAAYLITRLGLEREESRGVHYRRDFPEPDDAQWRRHQTVSRESLGLAGRAG